MADDDFPDDEMDFLDDEEPGPAVDEGEPWRILIVDDEPGMHTVTRLALRDIRFRDAAVEVISAFSGTEALDLLRGRSDIALILLDVVMETEDAGLRCARAIREDLGNRHVRIILRTGQPGQAPERQVIDGYDINDYKSKTELTRDKLYTAVIGMLRSYADILTIEQHRRVIDANRQSLLKIIDASATIFRVQSVSQFAQGALEQLQSLLFLDAPSLYATNGLCALSDDGRLTVVAATGGFTHGVGQEVDAVIGNGLRDRVAEAIAGNRSVMAPDAFIGFVNDGGHSTNLLVVDGPRPLAGADANLLELYCRNVGIAYENLRLRGEIDQTQHDIIYRLGEVVETRSKETGNHVRRVAEYSHILARAIGLDDERAEGIRIASPMHDVGKIGIPDAILNKPGHFDRDERAIMETHAAVGHSMLKDAQSRLLKVAATIAHQHHEKWNGSGYPRHLKGDEIDISGRIVALADVFDALASDRVYKKAWVMPRIHDFLREQRGEHFDPRLVDAFFANVEAIDRVRLAWADGA